MVKRSPPNDAAFNILNDELKCGFVGSLPFSGSSVFDGCLQKAWFFSYFVTHSTMLFVCGSSLSTKRHLTQDNSTLSSHFFWWVYITPFCLFVCLFFQNSAEIRKVSVTPCMIPLQIRYILSWQQLLLIPLLSLPCTCLIYLVLGFVRLFNRTSHLMTNHSHSVFTPGWNAFLRTTQSVANSPTKTFKSFNTSYYFQLKNILPERFHDTCSG